MARLAEVRNVGITATTVSRLERGRHHRQARPRALPTYGCHCRKQSQYDIRILTKTFDFASGRLARAIAATFARRQTKLPANLPDALTQEFAEDPLKQRQWAAFIASIDGAPELLKQVENELAPFLMDATILPQREL